MSSEDFLNNFRFAELTDDILAKCEPFICGHKDLDEFFQVDATKKQTTIHFFYCNHPIFDVFCICRGLRTFAPAKHVELCLV